jgi:hypothetical protein
MLISSLRFCVLPDAREALVATFGHISAERAVTGITLCCAAHRVRVYGRSVRIIFGGRGQKSRSRDLKVSRLLNTLRAPAHSESAGLVRLF